jgi:transcription initiation factor IIE alpha subunit
MINTSSGIPCPVCKTAIPFEIQQLLAGVQFSCPNCFASIGLAPESTPVVEETMTKFEKLKKSIQKK